MYILAIVCDVRRTFGLEQSYGMYVRYRKSAKTQDMYILAIVCDVRHTFGLEQRYGRFIGYHNAAETQGQQEVCHNQG